MNYILYIIDDICISFNGMNNAYSSKYNDDKTIRTKVHVKIIQNDVINYQMCCILRYN